MYFEEVSSTGMVLLCIKK